MTSYYVAAAAAAAAAFLPCSCSPNSTCSSARDGAAATWIEDNIVDAGKVTDIRSAGGSSWSSTAVVSTASGKRFFCKTSAAPAAAGMFRGEAEGLKAMHGG